MKLNEKEAVHCRTQEEFKKALIELVEKRGYTFGVCAWVNQYDFDKWKTYKDKTCIVLDNINGSTKRLGYSPTDYFYSKGYKFITYSEFMGESWSPKAGESAWTLYPYGNGFMICKEEYTNHYFKGSETWFFRTRRLAREAKKALEETLKKARKG